MSEDGMLACRRLAQGKVPIEGILRIGDDTRGTDLFKIATTHPNEKCQSVSFYECLVERKLFLLR